MKKGIIFDEKTPIQETSFADDYREMQLGQDRIGRVPDREIDLFPLSDRIAELEAWRIEHQTAFNTLLNTYNALELYVDDEIIPDLEVLNEAIDGIGTDIDSLINEIGDLNGGQEALFTVTGALADKTDDTNDDLDDLIERIEAAGGEATCNGDGSFTITITI